MDSLLDNLARSVTRRGVVKGTVLGLVAMFAPAASAPPVQAACPPGTCRNDNGICIAQCPYAQCCKDGVCVQETQCGSKPSCCLAGQCVPSCPAGQCCDRFYTGRAVCVNVDQCPSLWCCSEGTCRVRCPNQQVCFQGICI